MIRHFMHPINNHKSDADVRKMFDQITECVSGSVTHIREVATGAKNRHKREQS
jgi:hypothetical protein